MILCVDPDDHHAVINVQHEWLKTLQSKQPKTQISINAIEGKAPEKADYDLYKWLQNLRIWHKIKVLDIPLAKKMFQALESLFYVRFGDISFVMGVI
jgi:hypothetical protein